MMVFRHVGQLHRQEEVSPPSKIILLEKHVDEGRSED